MDDYGCFRKNEDDFLQIARILRLYKTITFSYSPDQITAFVITIAGPLKTTGIIPWGGRIDGLFLVALRRTGTEYFNLLGPNINFHPNYVSEKLALGKMDSESISVLLNEVGKLLREGVQKDG